MADMSLEFYKGSNTSPESEKIMTEKKRDNRDDGVCISDFGS